MSTARHVALFRVTMVARSSRRSTPTGSQPRSTKRGAQATLARCLSRGDRSRHPGDHRPRRQSQVRDNDATTHGAHRNP